MFLFVLWLFYLTLPNSFDLFPVFFGVAKLSLVLLDDQIVRVPVM